MKAVILSIKPKWCKLISDGKKTIELRKTRPKLEMPFKCYIYCTKDNYKSIFQSKQFLSHNGQVCHGKVIGEFVCDRIYQYSTGNVEGIDISDEDITKYSCLSKDEIGDYEMSAKPKENCIYRVGVYGWRISNVTIYDSPKDLIDFGLKRPPQSWCYVND